MEWGVLASIQPHWCELIASGEKSVEVRKTYPTRYDAGNEFKCFIYCTQGQKTHLASGKVIGEFICRVEVFGYNKNGYGLQDEERLLKLSCLTEKELYGYLKGKKAYGWHISNLVMYDKPRELSEFGLTRAPQSWQYVQCVA